jgi:hypothetical protein
MSFHGTDPFSLILKQIIGVAEFHRQSMVKDSRPVSLQCISAFQLAVSCPFTKTVSGGNL